jgi:hypothetical protein
VIGCLSILLSFQKSIAQCNCAGGAPATAEPHSFAFDSTTQFITQMTFPKFNPATGDLACGDLSGTFSTVTDMGILNKDSAEQTYQFLFTQLASVLGPGISASKTTTADFGPATVQKYGTPGNADSVYFGAQVTFQDQDISANITNLAHYLGTGDTIIQFRNTGSTLLVQGSNNYRSTVKTVAVGSFTLTYYWCPANVLASGIKNFTTKLKDNYIQAQWLAQNQSSNTVYELQVSTDGKNFKSVYIQPSQIADGTSTNYQYQYSIAQNNTGGTLYFRIKQTEMGGKITYTKINLVSLDEIRSSGALSIYPNPAIDKFSLQFDKAMTGDYMIDIISLTGQKIFSKMIRINNTNLVQFNLNTTPIPGMYYLRARDKNNGIVYSNKLFIKQ